MEEWRRRHKDKKVPAYFILFLRFGGALERGNTGRVLIAQFPDVLVTAGSGPPQESVKDLEHAGLTNSVEPRKTHLFADGARAFVRDAKNKGMGITSVAHHRMEFTRVLKIPKPGQARMAGTQCLDRLWQDLKRFVPRGIIAKRKGGPMHDAIWTYVQAFQWRRNLRRQGGSIFEELPKLT